MDYREFLETVVRELKEFYGNEAAVGVKNVIKNNDVHKDGLFITFTGKEENISPVIYLGSIFESFSDGSKTMEECVGMIAGMRKKLAADSRLTGMADELQDWDKVKDHVYPALISVSENKELLKSLVYTPFLDLATVYIIRKEYGVMGTATVKITNAMLNFYGVEKNRLHEQAVANMEKDNYKMEDILDLLHEMIPETAPDGLSGHAGLETGRVIMPIST